MISDDEHQNLILCRFGVLKIVRLRYEMKILRNVKLSKLKVKFFGEWLDKLRDDDKAVAIDLKPGVVGTVVSAQKLSNEITF